MARFFLIFASVCLMGLASAVPSSYQTYLLPEHRNALQSLRSMQDIPLTGYQYQIIPSDQYAVAEYYDPKDPLSIWDVIPIPSPITAVAAIATKALAIGKWLLSNSGFIIFGAALVIGFCAFTPYCTLIIEKPLASQMRSLNIPYLDEIEHYFRQSYDKYHDM